MSNPGFSRVRVLYVSESGSESESGPGFAVCQVEDNRHFLKTISRVAVQIKLSLSGIDVRSGEMKKLPGIESVLCTCDKVDHF